jgi:polyisoprenoid-binding protein YceI
MGKGTGSGAITGTMAFDRKEFGMNRGIPFKIADRVVSFFGYAA